MLIDEHGKFIETSVGKFYALMAKGNMANIALTDYLKRGLAMKGETGLVEAKINERSAWYTRNSTVIRSNNFSNGIGTDLCQHRKRSYFVKYEIKHIGTFKRMNVIPPRRYAGFRSEKQDRGRHIFRNQFC